MMNSVPRAAENPGLRQSAAVRRADFIESASVVDVLYDQLDYLVRHGGACPAECPDCARLEQVKSWLLLPFGSVVWQGGAPDLSSAAGSGSLRLAQ
ncbi:MAG: hypothetical protein LAP40_26800 [Acidobacteriia bacterium]|nr:hypothetical protein [Terriglobia bacterium]